MSLTSSEAPSDENATAILAFVRLAPNTCRPRSIRAYSSQKALRSASVKSCSCVSMHGTLTMRSFSRTMAHADG